MKTIKGKPERELGSYNLAELREGLLRVSRDPQFIQDHYYDGPLGAIYSPEGTLFKVWAPTAKKVNLLIFDGYYGRPNIKIPMKQEEDSGVFQVKIEGDCHRVTYRYELVFHDRYSLESVDPYSRAVTVNGHRSVVVDLEKTNPTQWKNRMPSFEDPSQAIIYECHVRDLTIGPDANVTYPGKFLGLSQRGTTNDQGSPTGLDYIHSLGVTHVELMPIFDFQTIDEAFEYPYEYNWGYDPQNFNAPEGSYASDPYDPICRIKELKTMIQAMHDVGLRVIMDVVFNHVYQVEDHPLHRTVPGYFFRYNEAGELTNGTGVGNDTASERGMMRKYIVESVKYWAEEYHIDGFRFDLMGIHDKKTMNLIRETLDQIDPSILMLGEGWDMFTTLADSEEANFHNAMDMPRIALFNDALRDALKGNDFDPYARGFINGAWYLEEQLVNNFLGCYNSQRFNNPQQLIQYAEAHDNYTLFDRLTLADPEIDQEEIVKRQSLAMALVLLAQGTPYIHAGQEFLRTKQGIRDSYNKPNDINQIDWSRQDTYQASVEFTRNLIRLRKREPLLRQTSYADIQANAKILQASDQIIALEYQGKSYDLVLIFNAKDVAVEFTLEEAPYQVLLSQGDFSFLNERKVINHIEVESHGVCVMRRYPKVDVSTEE